MKKHYLLLPFFITGLLSFKPYVNEIKVNKYENASNYTRTSNTTAEYDINSDSTYCYVRSFTLATRDIKKGYTKTIYLSNMPSGNNLYIYFSYYYQDGSEAYHQQFRKKKTDKTSNKFELSIPTTIQGFLHAIYTIDVPIFGYASKFAEFDIFLGWEEGNENIYNSKQFAPIEIDVNQASGKTYMHGDYFEIRRVPSVIEVDEYGTFYFNDLNIEIYREYYGSNDYYKFGNYYLSHDYNFFLYYNDGIFEPDKSKYLIPLTKNNDNKETLTLSNENKFYINEEDNSVYSYKKYNNLTETKDIYFPLFNYNDFKESYFYIGLSALGRAEFYFSYKFKVKFVKNNYIQKYDIVGEIDQKVEDDNLEDINL